MRGGVSPQGTTGQRWAQQRAHVGPAALHPSPKTRKAHPRRAARFRGDLHRGLLQSNQPDLPQLYKIRRCQAPIGECAAAGAAGLRASQAFVKSHSRRSTTAIEWPRAKEFASPVLRRRTPCSRTCLPPDAPSEGSLACALEGSGVLSSEDNRAAQAERSLACAARRKMFRGNRHAKSPECMSRSLAAPSPYRRSQSRAMPGRKRQPRHWLAHSAIKCCLRAACCVTFIDKEKGRTTPRRPTERITTSSPFCRQTHTR